MPLLERRGTPRRSDSTLSGSLQPSFLERFYFSALGYTFLGLGMAHMLLSTLAGYWLGLALGFSLAKIGLTALSMVYVTKQSKRLPWILEKLVLWGHSIVKKLFTVFRIPLYAFGFYIGVCVLVRVWSPDYLFRIDGMPKDCSLAPSPVHGCNRITVVIVPDEKVRQGPVAGGDAVVASHMDGAHTRRRLEEVASSQSSRSSQSSQSSTSAPKARKAPRPKDRGNRFEIVTSRDACLNVENVESMVNAWADGDATFVRRLTRIQDADGSVVVHWRVLSTIFGFADDLVVRIGPGIDDKGVDVDAQSQLRLGVGDLGVNKRRNLRLVQYLKALC